MRTLELSELPVTDDTTVLEPSHTDDPAADIVGRWPADAVPARAAVTLDVALRRPDDAVDRGAPRPGLDLDTLPGRELDHAELRELAARLAGRAELLAPHIAFDDEHRHYVSLHRDPYVDVWLICWTPENDTGWHDHDTSSGAVAVVSGELTEHNLAVGADAQNGVETSVTGGRVFSFGPDHIHRLTGKAAGSVSVHAYSPPLWRMGQYTLGAGGVLRRRSVSYAEELRPADETSDAG